MLSEDTIVIKEAEFIKGWYKSNVCNEGKRYSLTLSQNFA